MYTVESPTETATPFMALSSSAMILMPTKSLFESFKLSKNESISAKSEICLKVSEVLSTTVAVVELSNLGKRFFNSYFLQRIYASSVKILLSLVLPSSNCMGACTFMVASSFDNTAVSHCAARFLDALGGFNSST